MTLINGKEYEWSNIQVMINGLPCQTVFVNYKAKEELLYDFYYRRGETLFFRNEYNKFRVDIPKDIEKRFFKKGSKWIAK